MRGYPCFSGYMLKYLLLCHLHLLREESASVRGGLGTAGSTYNSATNLTTVFLMVAPPSPDINVDGALLGCASFFLLSRSLRLLDVNIDIRGEGLEKETVVKFVAGWMYFQTMFHKNKPYMYKELAPSLFRMWTCS